MQLLRSHSSARLRPLSNAGGLSRKELARVVSYIESNIKQRILLRQLADIVGLSTTYFARQFKRATGKSPLCWN